MRRIGIILAVIAAGELVFSLPFHAVRFFRPTFLDAFSISNTELGDMFAAYGIVAMLAYFPGGALADRYSPRNLIVTSLVATALGGIYLASMPGRTSLFLVYAYWGATTVFLLWGAMMRVTRSWGREAHQGFAFGLLDGGRGVVAVLAAGLAILLLEASLPEVVETASLDDKRAGLRLVLLAYSALTIIAALFAWLLIPAEHVGPASRPSPFTNMREVIRRPTLWAHAGLIVAAYSAYKGLDNYSLYAVEVLGRDQVEAARFVRDGAWLRPLAALAAGLLADRVGGSRLIAIMFAGLATSYLYLGTSQTTTWIVPANLFVTMFVAFGLRGVYFAIMNENRTPVHLTGATVGMVSFLGFTPDFFFGPLTGRILDANPGATGHAHYFLFLTGVAVAGLALTATMILLNRRGRERDGSNIAPA